MKFNKSIKTFKLFEKLQKKEINKFIKSKQSLLNELNKLYILKDDINDLKNVKNNVDQLNVTDFCMKRAYVMRLDNEYKIINNKIDFIKKEIYDLDEGIKRFSIKKEKIFEKWSALKKEQFHIISNRE